MTSKSLCIANFLILELILIIIITVYLVYLVLVMICIETLGICQITTHSVHNQRYLMRMYFAQNVVLQNAR